jgi:hypothetical protein
VTVVDSTCARLRNVKGIITSESKNCFYIVLDPKLTTSRPPTVPTSNVGAIRQQSAASLSSTKPPIMAVKTECTISIILPRALGVSSSNSNSSNIRNNDCETKSSTSEVGYDDDDGAGTGGKLSAASPGDAIRYDHNEVAERGRVFLLHGSHFMPFCKHDR